MPAALPTVASRPKRARVPAEEVEARAVDVAAPTTDTAVTLEGETDTCRAPFETIFLTIAAVTLRSKPTTAGARTRVMLN